MSSPDHDGSDKKLEIFFSKNDAFHTAMGRCIANWAFVDEEFFEIFRWCVGPKTQCAIIYYRTPALDVRMGLVDEIVQSVLPRPERKDGGHNHEDVKAWTAMFKEAHGLLATRRRVAHHPVHVAFYGQEDASGAIVDLELSLTAFEIYVSEHERERDPHKVWAALTIADLSAHSLAVAAVMRKLRDFRTDVLPKHRAEPPLRAQPPNQETGVVRIPNDP